MPRVNIEHVVSFSSEDPEYNAAGLVKAAAGGKGWRVSRGEARGAVVVQLARAVRVASVTVGAVNAATVEVLVGRAEAPDHYEVLVPTCMLLSPAESRRAGGADGARVRSFTDSNLTDAAKRSWDRMRLVLTQPYNKHVQFGLSFVQVYDPELPSSAPLCPIPLPLELNAADSDDEVFRPGELFAQRMQTAVAASEDKTTSTDTDAQIRQATSRVLKHIDVSATKLMRTSINKPPDHRDTHTRDDRPAAAPAAPTSSATQRDKPQLTDLKRDTNHPIHDKCHKLNTKRDRLHSEPDKSIRNNDEPDKKKNKRDGEDRGRHRHNTDNIQVNHENSSSAKDRDRNRSHTDHNQSKDERVTSDRGHTTHSNDNNNDGRAKASSDRSYSSGDSASAPRAPSSGSGGGGGGILSGVVFVLSGYEHPRRGSVRRAAETHGARARRDWGADCTHLICAFPNTPKMRAVRGSSNGRSARARVVTAEWVEASVAAGRALPWQWFATDPKQRQSPPRGLPAETQDQSEEGDTDDEIERVLRNKATAHSNTSRTDERDESNNSGADDTNTRSHSATTHQQRPHGDTDIDDTDTPDTAPQTNDDKVTKQSYSDLDSEAYNADTRPCSPAPAEPATIRRSLPAHPALEGRVVAGRGLSPGEGAVLERVVRAHGADWCEEAAMLGGSEPHCWLTVTGDWMQAHYRTAT